MNFHNCLCNIFWILLTQNSDVALIQNATDIKSSLIDQNNIYVVMTIHEFYAEFCSKRKS